MKTRNFLFSLSLLILLGSCGSRSFPSSDTSNVPKEYLLNPDQIERLKQEVQSRGSKELQTSSLEGFGTAAFRCPDAICSPDGCLICYPNPYGGKSCICYWIFF